MEFLKKDILDQKINLRIVIEEQDDLINHLKNQF